MKYCEDVLIITVSEFKVLKKLLMSWKLSESDLFKEFKLLSLSGLHNNDTIVYDWRNGSVTFVR